MSEEKKLYVILYLYNGRVLDKREEADGVLSLLDVDPEEFAVQRTHDGADGLFLMELSGRTKQSADLAARIAEQVDVPVYYYGDFDSKQAIDETVGSGIKGIVLNGSRKASCDLISYASTVCDVVLYTTTILPEAELQMLRSLGVSMLLQEGDKTFSCPLPVVHTGNLPMDEAMLLLQKGAYGIASDRFLNRAESFFAWKHCAREKGIAVCLPDISFAFSDFKKNSDGLVPVIVQDYRTLDVLMLAYINEEAWEHTIRTGHMTYYSRSRQELWEKGLTSGHFQYVKSIYADCDSDTLLARVYQVGAACHTGRRSCFFAPAYRYGEDESQKN